MADRTPAKHRPEERWHNYVNENLRAFLASKQHGQLRRAGLRALGRSRLLSAEEWGASGGTQDRLANQAYQAFLERCEAVADQFDLDSSTIILACLLRHYEREGGFAFPVFSANPPRILVVTEQQDALYLRWLVYEAWKLRLRVATEVAGSTMPLLVVPFPSRPEEELPVERRPAPARAFVLRLEFPPNFPPDGAASFARKVQQSSRELMRALGYPTRRRLRAQPLVARSKELRLGKTLQSGGIGDIVEESVGLDASKDPKERARVRRQRLRGKQQLDARLGPGPDASG